MNHKMACYGRPCLQGVLAQAKNGDELFCERNFIQPMGPMGRPKHALKVLCFLKKRFGWRGGFFSILHLVTNVFPWSSQCVLIRFPIFSLSSQCVLHNTSLKKQPDFFGINFGPSVAQFFHSTFLNPEGPVQPGLSGCTGPSPLWKVQFYFHLSNLSFSLIHLFIFFLHLFLLLPFFFSPSLNLSFLPFFFFSPLSFPLIAFIILFFWVLISTLNLKTLIKIRNLT